MAYCPSVFRTKRWRTREVLVGKVGVGGDNPIRIQSMTTSPTHDTEATVEQIMRLSDTGCEIARVTVQGNREAESCEAIKNALVQKGYFIPLVADIHFYPPAAMRVVDFVDKVRVNPGNFVDKRATFKVIEYDDASYNQELVRIEEVFSPLIEKCKRLKRSMRIGTNHGSLSDRIMNRYGDTAEGMVESALEFARVCRKLDYHDIIFSMKASNPLVMVQAYRLLVKEMMALGWDYPLHLGVTEAGEGEDGRVKSAMGIGSLLLDGLGDTIRVSLTEDPWEEIDPCKRLIAFAEHSLEKGVDPFCETHRAITRIERREPSLSVLPLHRDGTVILPVQELQIGDLKDVLGYKVQNLAPCKSCSTVDFLFLEKPMPIEPILLQILHSCGIGILTREKMPEGICTFTAETIPSSPSSPWILEIKKESDWRTLQQCAVKPALILFNPDASRLHAGRKFYQWLKDNQIAVPLIHYFDYTCEKQDLIIQASAELGSLFIDGIGEGICLKSAEDPAFIRSLSFTILQAVRMRTSRTEFISCPGCGRTLFDLQSVTKRIREKTAHLPGVKIAIMGCIVNGPGEMADADFGYVGSKTGKVDLYVGKRCEEKNIDSSIADERLIDLIKTHGLWVDPI
ncbi:MAG TPA: (E)-4-hydroxy-3-methylbut-2-enyl-diphosphate synthase [Rhabdochlamydiaceae bacterium]